MSYLPGCNSVLTADLTVGIVDSVIEKSDHVDDKGRQFVI